MENAYKHLAGLGRPASLLAWRAGPLGNSRYLYRLFPKGPARQASKLAGLPKPAKCL